MRRTGGGRPDRPDTLTGDRRGRRDKGPQADTAGGPKRTRALCHAPPSRPSAAPAPGAPTAPWLVTATARR
ncbi:hypothetical protein LC55x_3470 [Lysobacter capsici]|uniref:Uncharacterized protein n=1 Tax=Lysobacter capsici AZ78 TaxID=1444315 RepID=A0A125TZU2_9GAMM|nr:hypothetical protein LC55x_3470 [Lysobacter capsici]KWS02176.1 hypothetical protein AZ78_5309 [Lysobacter capsici AZ78]